jgi:hypothetical protein
MKSKLILCEPSSNDGGYFPKNPNQLVLEILLSADRQVRFEVL